MLDGKWGNESQFQKELEHLINKYSGENGSDTPDFILAGYLTKCLSAYNETIVARETWYGRYPGTPVTGTPLEDRI